MKYLYIRHFDNRVNLYYAGDRYGEIYHSVYKLDDLDPAIIKEAETNTEKLNELARKYDYVKFPPFILSNAKTIHDLQSTFYEYAFRHKKSRYMEDKKRYEKLRERFDNMIIGINKKIDYRNNDFIVTVLMRSVFFEDDRQISYEDKISYVKNNLSDLCKYVVGELKNNKSLLKKIGDLNFYRISRVAVTGASEIEFIFSPKKEIEKILMEL